MAALLTLAAKDLRLLLRDRFALFWILAFPIMYALFFGAIFSSEGGGGRGSLSLAIVDEDGSALSVALIARLEAHASLRIARDRERADDDEPTQRYDRESARADVRKGRRTAYLAIPAGFGDNPYALFSGAGSSAGPSLELGMDPSRKAEAGFMQGVLMEAVFGGIRARFSDKQALSDDIDRARADIAATDDLSLAQKLIMQTFMDALGSFIEQIDVDSLEAGSAGGGEAGDTAAGADEAHTDSGGGAPIELVEVAREQSKGPRSSFDITFPQSTAWGLMSVALGFAVTIVRERTGGTLLRLAIAPLSRAQVLAGKALACFVSCLGVMLFLLLFGVAAMGLQIDSPGLLALPMLCTAACFTGLMMVVSVMGKTENAVAGASWGLMMPFAMLGGGMIPLIAMPDWLQTASNVSFFKWSIYAIEGAVWRGFSLADMALPCAVLLAFGAGFFAIGIAVFRRTEP
ncbi:MAG: hypothetical protein DRQ55_05710 [Planctomycetota bacterium]|nr:MAG: hypothetical protein DRQ55_05710 [Planctomycetota bacterium]